MLAAQPISKPPGPSPNFESTEQLLRYVYTDLTRISQVVSADIILHPADQGLSSSRGPVRGITAVQAHAEEVVAATNGTVRLEVVSLIANDHFGAVLGTLHACSFEGGGKGNLNDDGGRKFAMPFCGLWRFVDGKAVEHWENATDPVRLRAWLMSSAGGVSS